MVRDPDSQKHHYFMTLASQNVAYYSRAQESGKPIPSLTCPKPEVAHFIPTHSALSWRVTQPLLPARGWVMLRSTLVTSTCLCPYVLETMPHTDGWSHSIIRLSTIVVSTVKGQFWIGLCSVLGIFAFISINTNFYTHSLYVWIFMLCFCTQCLDPGNLKTHSFF